MKNYRTPRTLAETEFTTGYPRVPRQRRFTLGDIVYGAVMFAAFAGIGVMLAWRA